MSTGEHEFDSAGCDGNAAPYVLGALEDAEHEAFRAHLGSCAVCREEVAALKLVADALPALAPQVSAPAELKNRVMADVRSEAGWERAPSEPPLAHEPSRRGWLIPYAVRPALGLAAVVAAVVVIAAGLFSGGGGGRHARVIRAEVLAPNATASVRLSGGHAELNIAGMPQTAPNRVYEVWIKRSGAAQPTDALFTPTAAGAATVGVPGGVAGVKQIMVTSEPLGGSRVPTTTPVIVATLG